MQVVFQLVIDGLRPDIEVSSYANLIAGKVTEALEGNGVSPRYVEDREIPVAVRCTATQIVSI
jgi:hypothetical protein